MSGNSDQEYVRYLKEIYQDENYYNQFLITEILPGCRVLDVGCGLGLLLKRLLTANQRYKLYGLDPSFYMLQESAKNCPQARLVRASGEKMPFKDGSFDYAFALDILEHTSEPRRVLSEIHRGLKSGGRLVVCTPDRLAYYNDPRLGNSRWSRFLSNLQRLFGMKFMDYTHKEEFTVLKFHSLLRESGFRIIQSSDLLESKIAKIIPFRSLTRLYLVIRRLMPLHRFGSMIYVVSAR